MKIKKTLWLLILPLFLAVFLYSCDEDVTDYKVSVTVEGEGNVKIGATDVTNKEISFSIGTQVSLVAEPKEGYKLEGWYEGETLKSNVATYSVKIIDTDISIKAKFVVDNTPKPTYYDFTVESVTNAFITGTASGNYESGTVIEVSIEPLDEFDFKGWIIDGEVVSTDTTYSFELTENTAISASLERKVVEVTCTLLITETNNGTITGSTSGQYKAGTEIKVTATPNNGYELDGWYQDGVKVSSDNEYTFIINDSNVLLTAKFNAKTLTIEEVIAETPATSDVKKDIITTGKVIALQYKGYWIADNTGAILVYLNAEINDTNAPKVGETIKLNGQVTTYGENYGYYTSQIVNPSYSQAPNLELELTSEVKEISSFFTNKPSTWKEAFDLDMFGKLITITGTVRGSGNFWYIDGTEENQWFRLNNLASKDGLTQGEVVTATVLVRDIYFADDTSQYGNYKQGCYGGIIYKFGALTNEKFDITVTAENGVLEKDYTGTYADGESITLSAKANEGYSFTGWYDGETLLSLESEYIYKVNGKDATIVAKFSEAQDVTIKQVVDAAAPMTATVKGTVIATYQKGFLLHDGTASILVYLGSAPTQVAGDYVEVSGTTVVYNKGMQFDSTATISSLTTGTDYTFTAEEMTAEEMTAYVASSTVVSGRYVTLEGILSTSGTTTIYYNIAVEGTEVVGSVSYPGADLGLADLNGKKIIVTGFVIGMSSSSSTGTNYVNIMATDVEVVAVPSVELTVSEIKEKADDVAVKFNGTVIYVGTNGFFAQDETGVIYVYNGSTAPAYEVGDVLTIEGNKDSYMGMPQIGSGYTATKTSTVTVDLTTAPLMTIAEVNALVNTDKATFGKIVTVRGYVETLDDQYVAIKLSSLLDTLSVQTKNSYQAGVVELKALDGKYVEATFIVYDFYDGAVRVFYVAGSATEETAPELTDEDKIALAKAEASKVIGTGNINESLTLPTTSNGVTITWVSSNTAVIANDGTLTMPAVTTTLTLTATFAIGETSDDEVYEVKVSVADPSNLHVVINQVYGGGGNSGALYTHDFIELYNPTDEDVDLKGWTLQYASKTGAFGSNVHKLTGTIKAHSYYLIQMAKGTGGSQDLPTPNETGSFAMAGKAFKVALVNDAVTVKNPTDANVVDFVGVGTGSDAVNLYEGSAAAATISNTTSARRTNGIDTDDNSADFTAGNIVLQESYQ